MKKEEKSLGDLGSELEQSIKQEDIRRDESKSSVNLLIHILVSLILIVVVVLVIFSFKKDSPLVKEIDYNDTNTLKASDASDYHFNWSFDKFKYLDWKIKGKSKTHLDTIINDFGLASSAEHRSIANTDGAILLTYDQDAFASTLKKGNHFVKLTFVKYGNIYTLQTKELYGLPISPYTDKISTAANVHKWTSQEYQSLKVGSSSDGNGGVDLESIIQTYGYPTSYQTSAYNDKITLRLRYYSLEQGEDTYLSFIAKADKMSFKLSRKQGDIND